ncbi:hypothetical protein HC928_06310 [bacterium]|nr:hypothetical protein [bacterium]
MTKSPSAIKLATLNFGGSRYAVFHKTAIFRLKFAFLLMVMAELSAALKRVDIVD